MYVPVHDTLADMFSLEQASKPLENKFAKNCPVYFGHIHKLIAKGFVPESEGVYPVTDELRKIFSVNWGKGNFETLTGTLCWKGQTVERGEDGEAGRPVLIVSSPQVVGAFDSCGPFGNLLATFPKPAPEAAVALPATTVTAMIGRSANANGLQHTRKFNLERDTVNPTSAEAVNWTRFKSDVKVTCFSPNPDRNGRDELDRDPESYRLMGLVRALHIYGTESSLTIPNRDRKTIAKALAAKGIKKADLKNGAVPKEKIQELVMFMMGSERSCGMPETKRTTEEDPDDPKKQKTVFHDGEYLPGTNSFKLEGRRVFVNKFSKPAGPNKKSIMSTKCLMVNGKHLSFDEVLPEIRDPDKPDCAASMTLPEYKLLGARPNGQITLTSISADQAIDFVHENALVSYVFGVRVQPNPGGPFDGHLAFDLKQVIILGESLHRRATNSGSFDNDEQVFEGTVSSSAYAQSLIAAARNKTVADSLPQLEEGGDEKEGEEEGAPDDDDDHLSQHSAESVERRKRNTPEGLRDTLADAALAKRARPN